MNKLFCANKPSGKTSNGFLQELRRKYGVKKAGFSGILDPFASGVIVVAFGAYTRLFRFLEISPKLYRAKIRLGATSPSLDTQDMQIIDNGKVLSQAPIKKAIEELRGKQSQIPPAFSAKKIDGKRAYALARKGEDVSLKPVDIEVFSTEFLSYTHPFIDFEISVSEGTYIRVLAQNILERLGAVGTLVELERVSEGGFFYNNEQALDPIKHLKIKQNIYHAKADLQNGAKIALEDLEVQKDGVYYLCDSHIRIIEIKQAKVNFVLNCIPKFTHV